MADVQSAPQPADAPTTDDTTQKPDLAVTTSTDENTDPLNTTAKSVKSTSGTIKPLISPISKSLSPKFKLEIPISLNIKNLFEQPKPHVDINKKPKNIEKLEALAKPLNTNKKFTQQLAEESEAAKQANKPHDLPEPKNIDFLKRISVPLVKTEKFNPEEEDRKAKEAAKNTNVRELPPPKNKDVLERLSSPLARNVTKKFSVLLDEEKEKEVKQKTLKKKNSSMKQPSKPAASPPAAAKGGEEKEEAAAAEEGEEKTEIQVDGAEGEKADE